MSEQASGFFAEEVRSSQQALDLVAGLLRVAEPGAVYGPPVAAGDRTVILASELTMSLGAGYGGGSSVKPATAQTAAAETAAAETAGNAEVAVERGGGGGGGGFAAGRPVAAVVIEPGGVRIEPVVDVTKLGIAVFTTLMAMFLAWSGMRRSIAKAKH
jgi:uncharacterized spore protein YtfJ